MIILAVVSFFIGTIVGTLTAAMCVAASKEDKKREDDLQK